MTDGLAGLRRQLTYEEAARLESVKGPEVQYRRWAQRLALGMIFGPQLTCNLAAAYLNLICNSLDFPLQLTFDRKSTQSKLGITIALFFCLFSMIWDRSWVSRRT